MKLTKEHIGKKVTLEGAWEFRNKDQGRSSATVLAIDGNSAWLKYDNGDYLSEFSDLNWKIFGQVKRPSERINEISASLVNIAGSEKTSLCRLDGFQITAIKLYLDEQAEKSK